MAHCSGLAPLEYMMLTEALPVERCDEKSYEQGALEVFIPLPPNTISTRGLPSQAPILASASVKHHLLVGRGAVGES